MNPASLFSSAVLQATLNFARTLPPFCVDFRSVYRFPDTVGSQWGNSGDAVLWAQRDRSEAFFDLCPDAPLQSLREIVSRFRGLRPGLYLGGLGAREEAAYGGYQLFTWDTLPKEDRMELWMEYVYVDPDRRGRGLRDAMQVCLVGAALLLGLVEGRDLRLVYRQVENPNNVERYLKAGFEAFYETDAEFPPASYQRIFGHRALRAHLHGLRLPGA
ncbi:MAG TPA: hypothetical protein VLJ37_00080 [bacterium]|nr:hypothetical protein [bacterium]